MSAKVDSGTAAADPIVRKLDLKLMILKALSSLNEVGMVPMRLLYDMSRYTKDVIDPMSSGILPEKEFTDMSSCTSSDNEPIDGGMVPVRKLSSRYKF